MFDSIYDAIKNESLDDVLRFLATDEDFTEDGGWNPLHAAGKTGNVAIIEAALRYIDNTSYSWFDINTECNYSVCLKISILPST